MTIEVISLNHSNRLNSTKNVGYHVDFIQDNESKWVMVFCGDYITKRAIPHRLS